MTAIKYILFAGVATGLNLLCQYMVLLAYDGIGNLYLAMAFGTLAGLVAKYILDKKYIFYHVPENQVKDAETFIFYTLTGVVTTAIFWGTEVGFNAWFRSENAKYAGAVTGLSIGYITKFFLDRNYVFREEAR